MTVLAIDPGNVYSAYAVIDEECRPLEFAKIDNTELIDHLDQLVYEYAGRDVVIEMIGSYGMGVGASVFDTCVWIGRFIERFRSLGVEPELIKRHPVKIHHCKTSRSKDSDVIKALVDRFAPGQKNFGKGTKANPGFFHGFKADVWQAMALAVYKADQLKGGVTK